MIRSRRWAVATVALATVIFATLELAPRLWGWFLPRAGRHLPQAATAAAGCVSALVALRAWSLEPKLWRARRILLLILCLAGAALAAGHRARGDHARCEGPSGGVWRGWRGGV